MPAAPTICRKWQPKNNLTITSGVLDERRMGAMINYRLID